MYVAAVGIDQYQSWTPLNNAVSDARGAYEAFLKLGFEAVCDPLFNGAATRTAMRALVDDRLQQLSSEDSLVMFFAGHGHTLSEPAHGNTVRHTGYLIPTDAQANHPRKEPPIGSWLLLAGWLTQLANLRAKHILVILDSCYSGIALAPIMRWLGDRQLAIPLDALKQRKSRRVMASALEYQQASDGAQQTRHSLFTECLIKGVSGEIAAQPGQTHITGVDIWSYVQNSFRGFKNIAQVPNFGAFENHDHGDFVIPLNVSQGRTPRQPLLTPPRPVVHHPEEDQPNRGQGSKYPIRVPVVDALVELAFNRLDLQQDRRKRRVPTLSIVVGESTAARTYWAKWAARHQRMVLMTTETTLEGITSDLLRQLPWVRCLPAARSKFSTAAQLSLDALDAGFGARSQVERRRWIGNVAGIDRHSRVSGWLLNVLTDDSAQIPDFTTAPVQGGDLLTTLCDLAAPLAILIHSPTPSEPWLQHMIPVAASLAERLRSHPIGLCTTTALADQVISSRGGAASMSMARQGRVDITASPLIGDAAVRRRARQVLFDALNNDRRTTNVFALDANVPTDEKRRFTPVDLMAKTIRLAIQIDDPTIFEDPQRYHDERIKDAWLQSAGFYVQRFLAVDVHDRLGSVIDEIATCLGNRRRARSIWETFHDQPA